MTFRAGPLLASLFDLEGFSPHPAGPSSCLPLVICLLGFLLAFFLSARKE
jgi:hypothetical protein